MNLSQYLKVGVEAAENASDFIKTQTKEVLSINFKGISDLVTNADIKSEQIIVDEITKAFPDHRFLTEESGLISDNSDFCWVIDPIDGTTNFVHGYPFYSISISLFYQGLPILGIVKHISTDEIYYATKSNGAFCNNKKIFVSKINNLSKSLLATGFGYKHEEIWEKNMVLHRKLTHLTQGVRRAGSAALDLCHVARGWLDGYWELDLNAWDIGAGIIIIQEAGGLATKVNGDEITLDDREILSSNGIIHTQIQKNLIN